ncbi:SGNH/GDSL hydrolase family protein [Paramicrobacterium chengjingii]|uniref:SGNH/GDSL hydrolase family protein n=1 Tax=Paramicrobacterium chengjingii TaxID=2769067 RepID=A0ABX6YL86_9MICO|nr:SGNH/GDSL hydrolase family protein [Microbacterium chengjingii]QPZ39445.1 SGNH/GDSL hydrolase family protein [Microbacterium chengjingii]
MTYATRNSYSGSPSSRRIAPPVRVLAVLTTAVAAFALTACDISPDMDSTENKGWTESSQAVEAGLSPVLFLGDSVAAGQAVALQQGFAESGVKFVDATSVGGGNVVGPNAEKQWETLPDQLEDAAEGVVIYQVTTYDWGTPDEQRDAYSRLAEAASSIDADLIFVSMPPLKPDDFYAPHMEELTSANEQAKSVADDLDGVEYLDASTVWGDDYSREHDGAIDRSDDGIHTCPQGAARFASWTLDELAELYSGFKPAEPDAWANTGWADSDVFHGC